MFRDPMGTQYTRKGGFGYLDGKALGVRFGWTDLGRWFGGFDETG